MPIGDIFTCAACGEQFSQLRSEEDALAEAEKRFGPIAPEDRAIVCDDCHKMVVAWIKTQN